MFNKIKSLLISETSKDSAIMFSGSVVSVIFSFILIVILTRNLSAAGLGLVLTGLTITQLLTDAFELGINPALMNFIPAASPIQKLIYIKTTFLLKLLTGIIVAVAVFYLAPFTATVFLKNESMTFFIQSSAVGIFLMSIILWGQTVFQAEQKFLYSSFLNALVNIIRTLAVLILVILALINPQSAFLVMQICLVIVVGLVFLLMKLDYLKVKATVFYWRQIIRFGLPLGISFALAAVYTKLDQLLIFNQTGEVEAGIYGLAYRVSLPLIFAVTALNSAITPRFTSVAGQAFWVYFKKSLLAVILLSVLGLLAIISAPVILPFIFGTSTRSSILPFQILVFGMICFILASPFVTAIIYRYHKPRFPFILSLLSLLLIYILLNLFIPNYKSVGAALAVALVYAGQLLLSLGYFRYLSKK